MGGPHIIHCFCSDVIEHPARASLIKSLAFDPHYILSLWQSFWPWDPERLNYDLLFDSLKVLQNLQHLSFDNYRRYYSALDEYSEFASITFPHLRRLAIGIPESKSGRSTIAQLFSRHPRLTHVCLWPNHEPFEKWDFNVPYLLPNLRHYEGYNMAPLDACCARTLQAARIPIPSWLTASTVPIWETLHSRTNKKLPFTLSIDLDLLNDDAMRSMLTSLSGEMPHIQCLQLRTCEDKIQITAVQALAELLEHFGRMEYFELTYNYYYEQDVKLCRQAVDIVAETCPTLRECCIGNQAWKTVNAQWVEYGRVAFEIDSGLSDFQGPRRRRYKSHSMAPTSQFWQSGAI
ncbi:hypothetical protein FB45DRAFT_875093 [Roridomyces roridus]|uniref:Uncharacterized protein n=1 Tax=Roridomyces roridus TaxID=1738132 RepID=A0AAD7FCJ3_9AGAR|nr:hypothetical protein FB45DRAFT_875093 [Roridomyces roridus]